MKTVRRVPMWLAIYTCAVAFICAQASGGVDMNSIATRVVHYDVSAINIAIPINGWGEVNPLGMMYALSNAEAIPNVA